MVSILLGQPGGVILKGNKLKETKKCAKKSVQPLMYLAPGVQLCAFEASLGENARAFPAGSLIFSTRCC